MAEYGLVFLIRGVLLARAGEFFEKVGVLDWGGDFVASASPFPEVEDAAAVGAEGEVLVGDEDDFAAGGAEECFGCRGGRFRHTPSLILFRGATRSKE